MIEKLLEGNKTYLKNDFERKKDTYLKLTTSQEPSVLWFGCSDSRVSPERITASRPGDIFVHRNIGNVIPTHDWNIASILEYALKYLKIRDIVICGHSDCGALHALDNDLSADSYIPMWINNVRDAQRRVDERMGPVTTPEDKVKRIREIELENVRLQLEHLRDYPLVSQAEKDGAVELHGLHYNLETGILSRVV